MAARKIHRPRRAASARPAPEARAVAAKRRGAPAASWPALPRISGLEDPHSMRSPWGRAPRPPAGVCLYSGCEGGGLGGALVTALRFLVGSVACLIPCSCRHRVAPGREAATSELSPRRHLAWVGRSSGDRPDTGIRRRLAWAGARGAARANPPLQPGLLMDRGGSSANPVLGDLSRFLRRGLLSPAFLVASLPAPALTGPRRELVYRARSARRREAAPAASARAAGERCSSPRRTHVPPMPLRGHPEAEFHDRGP